MSTAESFAGHRSRRCSWTGRGDRAASGETFEATSPATGEVIGTDAAGRSRRRPARPSPPRPRPADGVGGADRLRPRRALHRSPTSSSAAATSSPARSRSTRASRCTPRPTTRSTSCVDYWRMAAEDGKRLGGRAAQLVLARQAGHARAPPARRRSASSRPWNWPYTMPAELIAPALAGGNTVVWTPGADRRRCAPSRWPSASPRPTCRPASSTSSPAPGRWSATRSPPTRAPHAVGFIGSTATGRLVAEARRRQGRRCWRWAATARWSCSTTPTSTRRSRPPLTACFLCAGQSCTAGERLLVHRARARRVRRAPGARRGDRAGPARRPVRRRRRRWARSTTSGVAAKMDEHVGRRPDRGALAWWRAARAPTASRPTSTGTATILDGVADRRRRSRTEETFGPIAPVVAIGVPRAGDRR